MAGYLSRTQPNEQMSDGYGVYEMHRLWEWKENEQEMDPETENPK